MANKGSMPPTEKRPEPKLNTDESEQKTAADYKEQENKVEINKIKKLPLRTIFAGSKSYQGYYDENKLLIYLADEYGELTGQKAKIMKPLPPLEAETIIDREEETEDENTDDSIKEKVQNKIVEINKRTQSAAEKYGKSKHVSEKKNKSSSGALKKAAAACLILIIAAGIAIKLAPMLRMTPADVPVSMETNDTDIIVIRINADVIPGEQITENIISAYNIDTKTYNQIAINGNDLYRWEQRDSIIGMYAAEYISDGHYITTNSVVRSYSVPANPWDGPTDELESVAIPINIEGFDRTQLLVGSKINIRFKTNVNENSTTTTQESKVVGVKISQEQSVTTVDSYTIEGLVVYDLLTGSGESLYEKYYELGSIPEGNQERYLKNASKADKEFWSGIAPVKVCVIIDKEYAVALEQSVSNSENYSMSIADGTDVSTDDRRSCMELQRKLMDSIEKVL